MDSRSRMLMLLLVLSASVAAYYHLVYSANDSRISDSKSEKPPRAKKISKLDEDVKKEIQRLIADVEIPQEENNLNFAIKLDHGVGRKEMAKGNYKDSFRIYRKVLAISYRNNSLMGIGIALGILADVALLMDSQDEAMRLALLSYKVAKAINNPMEYGVTELRIANFLDNKDRLLAMQWRLKAKQSLQGTRYKQDYIRLLNDLADDSFWIGRQQLAMSTIDEAWRLVNGYGNGLPMKIVRAGVANTYADMLYKAERYHQALDILNANLADFTPERKESFEYVMLLFALGKNHLALGEDELARQYFAVAYSHYENHRSKAMGEDARAKLDANNVEIANRLIDTLIGEQDYYSALALLETNKARTLSDISKDTGQQASYRRLSELQSQHAQQRVALLEEFNERYQNDDPEALLNRVNQDPDEQWQAYRALIKKQQQELEDLSTELKLRDVAVAEALDAERIKEIQSQVLENEAVLSLYASDKNLQVLLITRNDLIYVPGDLNLDRYTSETEKLRAALLNPYVDFYRQPARVLANAILKPVEQYLGPNVDTLIYSPDGMFARIPLAVLPFDNEFIGQRYQILRIPSLASFEHRGNNRVVRTGISCVDPAIDNARLPFQQLTGEKLRLLYPNRLTNLSGADCTRAKLEQALAKVNDTAFLHIGAHGMFYQSDAMQSGVYLANGNQGEWWRASNIAGNDLRKIDLVTLSSCEAGLTNLNNRRDVFGIIRAMKFAGAKQILAPLWVVQDRATSVLMQRFYQAYSRGLSAPEALHEARLRLIGDEKYVHPYYWSGFVLTGGVL